MAQLSTLDFFKVTIMVMLFYGVSITLIAYALPADAKPYANSLVEGVSDNNLDYESVSADVQDSLANQKDIPLIDVGALVFYSGNLFVDLLLNFMTAIPQLITIVINGVLVLFGGGLDPLMMGILEGFSFAALVIFYSIAALQSILGIRSGRVI